MMIARPLFLGLALAACGASAAPIVPDAGAELLPGFTPAAPGPGELQVVSPIVRDIAPGADVLMCTYLPIEAGFATDVDITHVTGFQTQAGAHHAILYQARSNRPVDTHVCTDDDMANSIPLGITGGEGGDAFGIPDGLALRAAAHSQLFFQTHWVNTTDQAIDGQAAFNLTVQAPSTAVQTAGVFSIVSTQISVAAGATGSAAATCTFARDIQFGTLYGHAHEWGTHVRIVHTPMGGADDVIYDHDWIAHNAFAPPSLRYTVAAPFVVHAGDTVRVECSYDNTTDHELTFPFEMCAAAGFYFPGNAQLNCVDGGWPN
ncbi:MAG: hypothetical protein K8W52_16475 [Deltaproteobacteria bacterium]|nr:hypothetical protein [Deltaproteobacteria bacterium]